MINRRVLYIVVGLTAIGPAWSPCAEKDAAPATTVAETYCEYASNPIGIDTAQPRFTWVLGSERRGVLQQAYQVLVASSAESLVADKGDLWDSGRVKSDESSNVVYGGKELASRQSCHWKVRVWDDRGRLGPWSTPATFEIGLLTPGDWHGQWIEMAGANNKAVSPLLRKTFDVAGPVRRARLYAAGLGWSEYYLNGKRIGDHVLDPAATDYDKRILYVVHDVTDLLHTGPNVLGAMLGNGFFSEPPRPGYGDRPCLLLELVIESADGSVQRIVSDESWRVSTGPIVQNDIYFGEVYDARLEKTGWLEPGYDDAAWTAAGVRKSPGGRLEAQTIEPIKVNRVVRPVKVTSPKPGAYVFDFGQLFGGWVRLKAKGPAGTKIALRYATQLTTSGLADKRRHAGGNGATDVCILKGDPAGERYEPRFTYHPVQYLQIEGYSGTPTLEDIEGCMVYSSVDMTGDFQCSNALLNKVHRACVRTFTNGLYGFPLDCLYREHWGWLDPATDASMLFARQYMPQFWTKWLRDVQCAQHRDGVIPDVVPAYPLKGRTTGDPAWAGNYPLVVWYVYQSTGDRRLLEENYAAMKRWVDHLTTVADKTHRIEKGGYYNDHMLPGDAPGKEEFLSTETPAPLLWTGYYYNDAWIVARAAKILGRKDDAASYGRLAGAIRNGLNQKWLNAAASRYASGSQTANAFALALDIVPEANRDGVLRSLTTDIVNKRRGHLHTGNIGTTAVVDALPGLGRADVLYRVATATDYPGWGYMISKGAATIWEAWGGVQEGFVAQNSGEESMIMWASIQEFFYNDLAGIDGPDYYGTRPFAPGYREIRIRPRVVGDLSGASASIRTVRGNVATEWKRKGDSLGLKATVPVNARAKVGVPKAGMRDVTVEENGKVVWKNGVYVGGVDGVVSGIEDAEYVTFDVGSGSYRFVLRGSE